MENRKDDKVKGPRSMPEAVQASGVWGDWCWGGVREYREIS
jgi:hypothetical protein